MKPPYWCMHTCIYLRQVVDKTKSIKVSVEKSAQNCGCIAGATRKYMVQAQQWFCPYCWELLSIEQQVTRQKVSTETMLLRRPSRHRMISPAQTQPIWTVPTRKYSSCSMLQSHTSFYLITAIIERRKATSHHTGSVHPTSSSNHYTYVSIHRLTKRR